MSRLAPALTLILIIALTPTAVSQPLDSLAVSPTSFTAGSFQTITFRYFAGANGLEAGGGIRFELPVAYGETEPYFWSKPQTKLPDVPGFISATTSSGVGVSTKTYGIAGGIFECVLADGALGPGESITVTYRGVVQSLSGDMMVRYQVRESPAGEWVDAHRPPKVQIEARQAHTLITSTRSDVQLGAPVDVVVVAIDRFGNLADNFRGTIDLTTTDSVAHLPVREYAFTPSDGGRHVFDGIRFGSTGFQRIRATVRDLDSDLQISSHYTWVTRDAPRLQRFFGDTHFHTGTGTRNRGFISLPEAGDINTLETNKFQALNSGGDHRGNFTDAKSAYAYARDVVRLDFASSAEHDAILLDSAAWSLSQAISESYNDPGRFTTLFAYEWTVGFTHHVVVYRDSGNVVFDRDRYPDLRSLWEALDGQGAPALTIPHVTWSFDDHTIWDEVNDTYRKIGEIYSLWNNRFLVQPDDIPQRFELGANNKWSYQHAWDRGHRIGVVGSTDNHLGRPGANNYTIYTHHTGGFAAALASENSRNGIWDSFTNRRTYATTGTRIYLDFQADGYPMGSEYATADPPKLAGRVAGTNRLTRVDVVKYQDGVYSTIRSDLPVGETLSFEFTDAGFDGDCFYYLRVVQADEYPGRPWSHSTAEMAWSSPIWVRSKGIELQHGGIIRGKRHEPEIALVFTGNQFAEGLRHIRSVLKQRNVKASFFFTGHFYRNPAFAHEIRALVQEGHYLGAHSDQHLLYASWEDRDSMLVSRQEFEQDVLANYAAMKQFGIDRTDAPFFLPPYEWHNGAITDWTSDLDLTLINYSPGTRSHADYTTPDLDHYETSEAIFNSILAHEKNDPDGLNGFILLSHVGTDPARTDKFYERFGPLVDSLAAREYRFVRIDELLDE